MRPISVRNTGKPCSAVLATDLAEVPRFGYPAHRRIFDSSGDCRQRRIPRGFGFGAGVAYKGNSFADSLNLYEVPGYTTYDASLFYRVKKWDISLKLNNLTNQTWYASPTFTGALPGELRNVLLTARIRFD